MRTGREEVITSIVSSEYSYYSMYCTNHECKISHSTLRVETLGVYKYSLE